jgi:AcrR family transcriptional regulator
VTTSPVTDGRLLRGIRTRNLIVDALLDLLTEGTPSPTAAQIARRAGVSVRSVFQHFEDLESLYADLARQQAERVRPLLEARPTDGSLGDRVDALVEQRQRLYASIRPVRHAIGARADTSPALRRRLETLARQLREQLSTSFADELAGAPRLLDALDAACSFEAWDRMVTFQGLDEAGAADVLRWSIRRLLGLPD